MERAAGAARILTINARLAPCLDSDASASPQLWEPLIAISGDRKRFSELYSQAGPVSVFEFLAFRADNPHSILSCVRMVREHARGIRDRISRELWDEINSFHSLAVNFRPEDELETGPQRLCDAVKSGACRFIGVARDTLPADETWHFLEAGRALERAAITARIVDVEHGNTTPDACVDDHRRWMAVLEAVSAYDFYLRRYHARVQPDSAAELLVLDPRHPRSVRCNMKSLAGSLRAIGGTATGTLAAEAEGLTAAVCASLSCDRIEPLIARGLGSFLGQLQQHCRAIGEQIAHAYFYYPAPA
jgi:uncharacterized alpha-E superfamily protein